MAVHTGLTNSSTNGKKVPFLIGVTGGTSCGKVRDINYDSMVAPLECVDWTVPLKVCLDRAVSRRSQTRSSCIGMLSAHVS